MIIIRKGLPPAIPVPIGAGAVVMVRPATAFQVDVASAKAMKFLAPLLAGVTSADDAERIFGADFKRADFTDPQWAQAVAERIAVIELAKVCVESWEGIGDEDGNPLPVSPETVTMILRDSETSRRIKMVLNASVHEVTPEALAAAAQPPAGEVAGHA